MTKHILLLFTVLLLAGCRKTGKGKVEGYAYVEGFNTPVANTQIELWRRDRHDQAVKLQSVLTDDSGYFSFNFRKQHNYYYYLSLNQYKGFPNYRTLDDKFSQVFFAVKPVTLIKCKLNNRQLVDVDVILKTTSYNVFYQRVKKGDSATALLTAYGYGTNNFSWYWFPVSTKTYSDTVTESYSLLTPTDTLYRTIDVSR